MKKNVLALSIATMVGGLGFAGAAFAAAGDITVNESGAGSILTVPYYSAQNGNMTVIHLTNTDTKNGKAVKVRFRGASNSDDVLDFQIFMSPGDVWTGAVTKNAATGLAQLSTGDNSCTMPARLGKGETIPFVTNRLKHPAWSADDKAAQTREGYIEILNMANIDPTLKYKTDGVTPDNLYTAIKHKDGVAPCTSSIMNATLKWEVVAQADAAFGADGSDTLKASAPWLATTADNDVAGNEKVKQGGRILVADSTKTVWSGDTGLRSPTGGLTGHWYVMNVEQTTTYSGAATAIQVEAGAANVPLVVFSPQKYGPAKLSTADPLMQGTTPFVETQFYDVPDLSTPYVSATNATIGTAAAQASALTTAIVRESVANQFATDAGVFGKTDWVFSMPTRRYTIAANYDTEFTGTNWKLAPYSVVTGGTYAVPAGVLSDLPKVYRVINGDITGSNNIFQKPAKTTVEGSLICVTADSNVFRDREETSEDDGAIFSPGEPTKTRLCGEVSVLSFTKDNSALGAALTRQNVQAPYTNGWGIVSFGTVAAGDGVPMLGNAFIKLTNGQAAAGVSGTYGITWPHTFN